MPPAVGESFEGAHVSNRSNVPPDDFLHSSAAGAAQCSPAHARAVVECIRHREGRQDDGAYGDAAFWQITLDTVLDRGYNTIKHCDKTAKTVLAVLSQLF